jgi:hypothetical protein
VSLRRLVFHDDAAGVNYFADGYLGYTKCARLFPEHIIDGRPFGSKPGKLSASESAVRNHRIPVHIKSKF